MRTSSGRRTLSILLAASVVGAVCVLGAAPASAAFTTRAPVWTRTLPKGAIFESSPALADFDGAGRLDVVVGSWDRNVYAVRGADGADVPGWPQQTSNQVNSSAAVADVDGDARPEVFVGSGTANDAKGALYSFGADGSLRWRDASPEVDYPAGAAIHATPALGDLDADGKLDVAAAALGVWSIRQHHSDGRPQAGFPHLAGDTMFASPAIADLDGDGAVEAVYAGDSSPGPVWHQGGRVKAVADGGKVLWEIKTNDIVRSSPSVGDVDGDGRLEVVFGGGDYWGGTDSVKVWAVDAATGTVEWTRDTDGVPLGSPALADVNGDGRLDVTIGTWVSHHGRGAGGSVYVLDGRNGRDLPGYPVPSGGGGVQGSIVTVDLNADGAQDPVVTTGPFIALFDGRTGENVMRLGVNLGIGFGNSAAVADVDGNGLLDVIGAGPRSNGDGMIARWELPATAKLGGLGWHQFRKDARRTGSWTTGVPNSGVLGHDRRSGESRYSTAAATSAAVQAGVGTVYVASGEGFADALGAGPVAAKDGTAVLLVQRDFLPGETRARLEQLRPKEIVVLGGSGTVSDAVVEQLRGLGPVTRVAGADRADTAARLSARAFAPGVPVAYVVTGGDFPDGLAASAAAGRAKAPILLALGGGLPASTTSELRRLNPATIVVVGGTAAIPLATEVELRGYARQGASRVAGVDRYATAAAVARLGFDSATVAYLATGATFPDALTGGAAAAQAGAPLLLTPGNCLRDNTRAELDRLGVTRAVLLGGVLAVSSAVASLNPC